MWKLSIPLIIFVLYEIAQLYWLSQEKQRRGLSSIDFTSSHIIIGSAASILILLSLFVLKQFSKINMFLSIAFIALLIINRRVRFQISASDKERK